MTIEELGHCKARSAEAITNDVQQPKLINVYLRFKPNRVILLLVGLNL